MAGQIKTPRKKCTKNVRKLSYPGGSPPICERRNESVSKITNVPPRYGPVHIQTSNETSQSSLGSINEVRCNTFTLQCTYWIFTT